MPPPPPTQPPFSTADAAGPPWFAPAVLLALGVAGIVMGQKPKA